MCKRVLFSALLFSAFVFGAAAASPRFVHVSWSQPDTATTMTITWMSDSVSDSSLVRFGVESTDEFQEEGYSFQGNGELGAIHVVELTQLDPDLSYVYQVGGPAGGWSGEYSFSTGVDPCQQFKFAALGDNRPDTDWLPQFHWNPVLKETVADGPRFILHTGDIVKSGDETGQWNTFFETSEPHMADTPVMPGIGNHDDGPGQGESANYNQVFSLPVNDVTDTEDYYYFIYGNAIFVSLSSQTFSGGATKFQEQAQWLDKVLTENPAMWRFVYLHHPPYTSHLLFDLIFTEVEFNHPPNENGQNPALVPIFDKHHVDIVFTGHNHYYERLGPMVQGSGPDEGTPVAGFHEGTVYVVTGGGGAFVYDEFDIFGIQLDLVSWVCGPGNKAPGSTVCKGDLHYVSVEINDNVLVYEAWSTAEQTLGYNPDNKQLLDTFIIEKEPAEECAEPVVPDVVEEPTAIVEEASTGPEAPDWEIVTQPEQVPEVVDQEAVTLEEIAGELPVPAGDAAIHAEPGSELFPGPESDGTSGDKGGGCGCRLSAAPRPGAGVLLILAMALLLMGLARAGLRRP